ncbi:MAG: M48 family metallopeptidase [Paracoccaceae bacterium]
MLKRFLFPLLLLAACDVPTTSSQQVVQRAPAGPTMSASQARQVFARVRSVVEPVAERECRARIASGNCDFKIGIDSDPDAQPNAYQTRDKTGRPLIIFTSTILPTFSNADEIAFVMGHEAAHHIQGHLDRQQRDAAAGAIILAGIAAATGGNTAVVQQALDTGAYVGSRSYSKEYELEADRLGTVITARAGYNPNTGLQYFFRLPDPGDQFLGTHPPNRNRIAAVQKTIQDNGF